MAARAVKVNHATIYCWAQSYLPELARSVRLHLSRMNDSRRVVAIDVKVKGVWKYLYQAVDSMGNPLDFILSVKRDRKAAERFFSRVSKAESTTSPRV